MTAMTVSAFLFFAFVHCAWSAPFQQSHTLVSDVASRHLLQNFRTGRSRLIAPPGRDSANFAEAQAISALSQGGGSATFFPVSDARRKLLQINNVTYEEYNFNFTYSARDSDIISYWDKQQADCGGGISNLFFYLYQSKALVCEFSYFIYFDAVEDGWHWNLADFQNADLDYPPTTSNLARQATRVQCGDDFSPPGYYPDNPPEEPLAPPPSPPPPPAPPPPIAIPSFCTLDVVLSQPLNVRYSTMDCANFVSAVRTAFNAGVRFQTPFQCALADVGVVDAFAVIPSSSNGTFYDKFINSDGTYLYNTFQRFLSRSCTTAVLYAATRPPCPVVSVSRFFTCPTTVAWSPPPPPPQTCGPNEVQLAGFPQDMQCNRDSCNSPYRLVFKNATDFSDNTTRTCLSVYGNPCVESEACCNMMLRRVHMVFDVKCIPAIKSASVYVTPTIGGNIVYDTKNGRDWGIFRVSANEAVPVDNGIGMEFCVVLGSPCRTLDQFCYGDSCYNGFYSGLPGQPDNTCCPIFADILYPAA